jgi:hypothetical protein
MKASMLFLVVTLFVSTSCGRQSNALSKKGNEITVPEPPVIIYKCSANYIDNVAVSLTSDGKSIESFPAPSDIRAMLNSVKPVELSNGFLLDRQGININSAFLNYTFKEYSRLGSTPRASDLLNEIKGEDVITEIYKCPFRRSDPQLTEKLNQLIKEKRLDKCEALNLK